MKHLYPELVSGIGSPVIKRLTLIIVVIIYNAVAEAQSLNFNAPVLESGTANQPGCVYRFKAVTGGGLIDALVKVDSLIGVTLYDIDATPSGASTTALQPQLQSLGGEGWHYAVLTITFVNVASTVPSPVYNFSSVFMGLDGSNQMTEFNAITVDNPVWEYCSSTPKVSVTREGDMIWGNATSNTPTGGAGIDETDSTQMFRVSSPAPASVIMRVGYYQNQPGWRGNDLFSLNMRGAELEPIILPVQLLSFTAQLANEKVWLAWSTSKEANLSHYTIERSYDNKQFDQVALMFSAENPAAINNYSYKDPIKNAAAAVIYYRLKMVDKDGKFTYSEVRSVRLGNGNETAKIAAYPNPVLNELRISIPQNWQNETVTGQLLNTVGSVIKRFNITTGAVISMRDVPPGTYYIKVVKGREISTHTIVKSRH
ncbi:T9SS type A sorting domain-containing protein [Longitalea luteola]|uniref:T9SS type A sorting domain-containing protein n=1 Tax=Longitalea luteola TaxID=2812563 RepID=UPI001A9793E0|nr:T9SS type A sorting domain-containing protein [Longitalea luteola]